MKQRKIIYENAQLPDDYSPDRYEFRTLPGVTLTTISVTCSGVKLIMFPELFRKTLDFEPDWEYDCLGKIRFPSTLNRFDCTRR